MATPCPCCLTAARTAVCAVGFAAQQPPSASNAESKYSKQAQQAKQASKASKQSKHEIVQEGAGNDIMTDTILVATDPSFSTVRVRTHSQDSRIAARHGGGWRIVGSRSHSPSVSLFETPERPMAVT
jgi:hypothetical protein